MDEIPKLLVSRNLQQLHGQTTVSYYQTVYGLNTKTFDFNNVLACDAMDIILMAEAWASEGLLVCKFFTSDFIVFFKDRRAERGGGVLVANEVSLLMQ